MTTRVSNKLKESQLESKIKAELYHIFPGTHTTVCLLLLDNGYSLIGESSPATAGGYFSQAKGRRVAKNHAFSKLYALDGYARKEMLRLSETGEN